MNDSPQSFWDWMLKQGLAQGIGLLAILMFLGIMFWIAVILVRELKVWLPKYFAQKIEESQELVKNATQQTILMQQQTYMMRCMHENTHATIAGLRLAANAAYEQLRQRKTKYDIDSSVLEAARRTMQAFYSRPRHDHERDSNEPDGERQSA